MERALAHLELSGTREAHLEQPQATWNARRAFGTIWNARSAFGTAEGYMERAKRHWNSQRLYGTRLGAFGTMKTTTEDRELAERIRQYMVSHHLTLATAESCTSGRIAATLTSVSGASDYFQGGMVVYQNELKTRFLGVSPELIAEHDVVSEAVVRQMAEGCLELYGTDYCICSTGYTGGGSERVASGTIWLAYGRKGDIHTHCLHLDTSREDNTATAALTAVKLLAAIL